VTRGVVSLEEALARRRSIRDFSGEPVTLRELSQLLWAAQGTTTPEGARTSPSAGATYPLELYVATPSACHHYVAGGHRLERLGADDLRPSLAEAAYGQTAILEATVVIVVTAVLARTRARYGARASRYVSLEAGHVAQSILLQAAALGLGAVPIGAFDDDRLRRALGVASEPVYVVAIGHPRHSGR
jgi:SagB-type dehydrogenase family enzyme